MCDKSTDRNHLIPTEGRVESFMKVVAKAGRMVGLARRDGEGGQKSLERSREPCTACPQSAISSQSPRLSSPQALLTVTGRICWPLTIWLLVGLVSSRRLHAWKEKIRIFVPPAPFLQGHRLAVAAFGHQRPQLLSRLSGLTQF